MAAQWSTFNIAKTRLTTTVSGKTIAERSLVKPSIGVVPTDVDNDALFVALSEHIVNTVRRSNPDLLSELQASWSEDELVLATVAMTACKPVSNTNARSTLATEHFGLYVAFKNVFHVALTKDELMTITKLIVIDKYTFCAYNSVFPGSRGRFSPHRRAIVATSMVDLFNAVHNNRTQEQMVAGGYPHLYREVPSASLKETLKFSLVPEATGRQRPYTFLNYEMNGWMPCLPWETRCYLVDTWYMASPQLRVTATCLLELFGCREVHPLSVLLKSSFAYPTVAFTELVLIMHDCYNWCFDCGDAVYDEIYGMGSVHFTSMRAAGDASDWHCPPGAFHFAGAMKGEAWDHFLKDCKEDRPWADMIINDPWDNDLLTSVYEALGPALLWRESADPEVARNRDETKEEYVARIATKRKEKIEHAVREVSSMLEREHNHVETFLLATNDWSEVHHILGGVIAQYEEHTFSAGIDLAPIILAFAGFNRRAYIRSKAILNIDYVANWVQEASVLMHTQVARFFKGRRKEMQVSLPVAHSGTCLDKDTTIPAVLGCFVNRAHERVFKLSVNRRATFVPGKIMFKAIAAFDHIKKQFQHYSATMNGSDPFFNDHHTSVPVKINLKNQRIEYEDFLTRDLLKGSMAKLGYHRALASGQNAILQAVTLLPARQSM